MIFRRKRNFFLAIFCLSSANEISCCQGLSVFIMSLCEVHTSVCMSVYLSHCTPLCWSVCLGSCCHYKCIKTVGNFTPIFFHSFPGNFVATFFNFYFACILLFLAYFLQLRTKTSSSLGEIYALGRHSMGLPCLSLSLSVCPSVSLSVCPFVFTLHDN